MCRGQLFVRLCALADALQRQVDALPLSHRKVALRALVDALDVLIDDVVDQPITELPDGLPVLLETTPCNDR